MIGVQREITERAIELLRLPEDRPCFVLDVGCGSGLSGKVLEDKGHVWLGCDVSRDMIDVANERIDHKREVAAAMRNKGNGEEDEEMDGDSGEEDGDGCRLASTGDLLHQDMGTGLPFRPATFDACISISALQWLCYSNSKGQNPKTRLTRFFSSLYQVLRRGARAVLQFYPETAEQAIMISECAATGICWWYCSRLPKLNQSQKALPGTFFRTILQSAEGPYRWCFVERGANWGKSGWERIQ